MMSTSFQDYYLYTRHFSRLKRPGIYLDSAANDARLYSNSYFLDACLGWQGICVEADPKHTDGFKKYRTCEVVSNCVSNREGHKVSFLVAGPYGGVIDTNRNMMKRPEMVGQGRHINKLLDKGYQLTLLCTTVKNILVQNMVTVVDYFSLDVEGHELSVLEGIDWAKVRFNVLTVEISATTKVAIESFLTSKGYVHHIPTLNNDTKHSGVLHQDAIYLHNSVSFGNPV